MTTLDVSTEPTVLTERHGLVALIVLNRPAKLNALNRQLLAELDAALVALDADPEIGCIVVTGAGERAFSAGGDLAELGHGQSSGPAEAPSAPRRAVSRYLRGRGKPVIAAIRGFCYGGAALMSLGADIRIGAEDARFKFHGAGYGVVAGAALLPRIVGDAKARELLLTGDDCDAQSALKMGLLNRVVPVAELRAFSLAMADRIAANVPDAVAGLRTVLDLGLPPEDGLRQEEALSAAIAATGGTRERMRQAADRVVGPR
jgi:enoyl-CoA hydratase